MLVNTGEQIRNPKINQVVFFQPWQDRRERRKKPYPVIINDGCYVDPIYQRLSNHWTWQRLTPTGRIRPEVEGGYGNFTKAEGYEITRKITVLK
jgi:hypothetical protein